MIKFFRRIRFDLMQNPTSSKASPSVKTGKPASRTGRYFKYALGEIVLVVIGILIALQINNWNVKNNQQNDIKEYAKLLIQDIEEDTLMVNLNIKLINAISTNIDSLAISVQNGKIEDISNIDFLCLTWKVLYRPYKWNRTTFNQLENSGSLQYIENALLRKKIGNYYAEADHMDDDYLNDKSKAGFAFQLISQVTNINYSNIKELNSNVLFKINNPEFGEFYYYTHPEYLKAKAQNLKLITTEINDVNKVINNLIMLQTYYDIRSKMELVNLTKDAKEIIVLLKEAYHE